MITKFQKIINDFSGDYRFLSNFYPANILFDGEIYPTAEHLYQALKTTNIPVRSMIRNLKTPGKAKRQGKKIKLRADWDIIRTTVMTEVVKMKFFQNRDLAFLLLKTRGKFLVEGNNWHDNFWGICNCNSCMKVEHPICNQLGLALMLVREELKILHIEEL